VHPVGEIAATEVESWVCRVLRGEAIGRADALTLLREAEHNPWPLLFTAGRVREHFHGRRIHLCSIAPVKIGRCSEDCHWCSQSGHWKTPVESRGLMAVEDLVRMAQAAATCGATSFGLVTSGARLSEKELAQVEKAREQADRLAAAGFRRYNHNLETSAQHFPCVCSTHTYESRVESARAALASGLELCSGGIFGVGESDEDRVDLALAIRDLGARVVPLNFLHPIPGTPLQDAAPLAPLKILSIVAMFRLVLPDRRIKLAGGREKNLRGLQSLMFQAGADACLIGNYLTTAGRPAEEDLEMIRDLGLEPAGAGGGTAGASPNA